MSHLRFVVLSLLLASVPRAPAADLPAPRPNVVVILSDDLGYRSLNCYGADPKYVRTPHLDRLAREGMRFTQACTPSSVCSPTRYGLLTGRYAWRSRLKSGVLDVAEPVLIEPGRPTLGTLLRAQGYATAAVGKWHLGLGSVRSADFTRPLTPGPREAGFDHFFGLAANHGDYTGVYLENESVFGLRSPLLRPYGRNYYNPQKPFLGLDAPQRRDDEVMARFTDRCVEWIAGRDAAQPFFLYFAPVAAHEPSTPSERTRGTSGCGPYGDWIHELDLSVGRLLDVLDRTGRTANTLVLFTSDNGGAIVPAGDRPEAVAYAAGFRANGELRARKHSIYEGGFRVPYLVRWPGHVPAGAVSDEPVNLVDTFATLAAVLGVPLPAVRAGAEDSRNVLPAWLGRTGPGVGRTDMILHSAEGNFAVKEGRWKWIQGKPHPAALARGVKARAAEFHEQLFDLQTDPEEKNNLLSRHPETARRLAARLQEWQKQGHSRE